MMKCKNCGKSKEEHCEATDTKTNEKVLVCMDGFWDKCFKHQRPTFFEECS